MTADELATVLLILAGGSLVLFLAQVAAVAAGRQRHAYSLWLLLACLLACVAVVLR